MNALAFSTDAPISKKSWISIAQSRLKVHELRWREGGRELFEMNSAGTFAWVEEEVTGGLFQFNHFVNFADADLNPTKRSHVDLLKVISQDLEIDVLTAEEGSNPYLFIHIEPSGQTSTIGVEPELYDTTNGLSIESICPQFFGGIAVKAPLEEQERNFLLEHLATLIPSPTLTVMTVDSMNNDFSHYRGKFDVLAKYDTYYTIYPGVKDTWYSKEERAERLVHIITKFRTKINQDICVFPANSGEVINIPGGSDSEHFCIHVTHTDNDKIVYRARRERW